MKKSTQLGASRYVRSSVLMRVIKLKMGAICSTHGANISLENLKGSGHLDVGGLAGRVILKCVHGGRGMSYVWVGNGAEDVTNLRVS
jgi:hypothetical protein